MGEKGGGGGGGGSAWCDNPSEQPSGKLTNLIISRTVQNGTLKKGGVGRSRERGGTGRGRRKL